MPTNENNKTVILSTKVTPEMAEKFAFIAERKGFNSPYEFLQSVVDCIICFNDAPSHASESLKQLMSIFDECIYNTFKLRPTNPPIGGYAEIHKAILFVRHTRKKFDYLVTVDKPFLGDYNEDYNVLTMWSQFMQTAFPRQWQKLTNIARAIGADNQFEAMQYLLEDAETPSMSDDERTYSELFGDNTRDITGANLNVYDKKYIMHQHHNIDKLSNGKR